MGATSQWLTLQQVADMLSLDYRTIAKYARRGELPGAVRVGTRNPNSVLDTRAVRVPADSIDLLLHGIGSRETHLESGVPHDAE